MTGIALVGSGYVADFYAATLRQYPSLRIIGVHDRNPARAHAFAERYSAPAYPSLETLFTDPRVEVVVNLTNPASHESVTRQALDAGLHVYSEKPVALDVAGADSLVQLAESRGLVLAVAPCSLLGEAAQTVWSALRCGAVGTPRLTYAELDDGAVHQMGYRQWVSDSGAPWPYADEFAVGPALEHAAYYLNWLTAFFGPVVEVTAFSTVLVPDKSVDDTSRGELATTRVAPDLVVGCLRHVSGMVTRMTCTTLAPENRSLTVVGDDGVLTLPDAWDFGAQPSLRRRVPADRLDDADEYLEEPVPLRPLSGPPLAGTPRSDRNDSHSMDFARGIAELVDAIREWREPRGISARQGRHVLEVVLAMTAGDGVTRRMLTSFDPVAPEPWAGASTSAISRVGAVA